MTGIQWTEQTWNPIVGCSVVSPGCTNCYAMKDAWRKNANPNTPQYHGLTKKVNGNPVWTGDVKLVEHKLSEPIRRKKPTIYFVNSMGDLFHEDVPDEWIDRVFAVMALSPQHTFQVLTKRAERMREYALSRNGMGNADICREINNIPARLGNRHGALQMPLPNVWLGVSVEDKRRRERIRLLQQTPAALRFLSCEPLLEDLGYLDLDGIGWVIVGGESGHGARGFDINWAGRVLGQCQALGIPCFVKQLGAKPYKSPMYDGDTGHEITFLDKKGGDISEWPQDLRVREVPS